MAMQSKDYETPRGVMIATVILAVVVLLPSMLGFVNKLMEFMHATRDNPDGAYVLTPMINYFLASAGFFCFLIWATMKGMFHDIEAPKRVMIEHEQELDADEAPYTPAWAGGGGWVQVEK